MISGSIVALVTPMDASGAIDWAALERLVELQVSAGTAAIAAVGTTGESATLDVDEHLEVIRRTVAMAAGRVAVIAGTGANSTREAMELTQMASGLGVAACLLVTPYYNKPTQEGLYRHFRTVAEAVDIPQILYNVPGRTACDMANETVLRLAAVPGIVGIKDATGNLDRAGELINRAPKDFALYSGDDASTCAFILMGGHGAISVTANVAPRLMHEMNTLALAADAAGARAINAKLIGLHRHLFCEANPIPVKWAVHQMGLIGPALRLPLTELAPQFHEQVRAAMKQAGVLN